MGPPAKSSERSPPIPGRRHALYSCRFAACHTRPDPKGVCCPQALPVVVRTSVRSQVLSAPKDGRFLRISVIDRESQQPVPQAERHTVTIQGISLGQSRSPQRVRLANYSTRSVERLGLCDLWRLSSAPAMTGTSQHSMSAEWFPDVGRPGSLRCRLRN